MSTPQSQIDLSDFAKSAKELPQPSKATPSPAQPAQIDLADFATNAKELATKFGTKSFTPQDIDTLAAQYGLTKTSGDRSPSSNAAAGGATRSFHLWKNQARDYGGNPQQMRKFAEAVRDTYGSNVAELFHSDISIKNGQQGKVRTDHNDHVHVAWKPIPTPIEGVSGAGQAALAKGVGQSPNKLTQGAKAVDINRTIIQPQQGQNKVLTVKKLTPKPVNTEKYYSQEEEDLRQQFELLKQEEGSLKQDTERRQFEPMRKLIKYGWRNYSVFDKEGNEWFNIEPPNGKLPPASNRTSETLQGSLQTKSSIGLNVDELTIGGYTSQVPQVISKSADALKKKPEQLTKSEEEKSIKKAWNSVNTTRYNQYVKDLVADPAYLKSLENLSSEEAKYKALAIAKERPLDEKERTALGVKLLPVIQDLETILAGMGKAVGSKFKGMGRIIDEYPILAPLVNPVISLNKELTGNNVYKEGGEALSKVSTLVSNLHGRRGTLGELEEAAGHMAPDIVTRLNPIGMGISTALGTYGEGATPFQSLEAGAKTAAMVKLGGALVSKVPAMEALPKVLQPVGRFGGRVAANTAAPIAVDIATGTPITKDSLTHAAAFGVVFSALPHGVKQKARQGTGEGELTRPQEEVARQIEERVNRGEEITYETLSRDEQILLERTADNLSQPRPTKEQNEALKELGFNREQRRAMTSEQAQQVIDSQGGKGQKGQVELVNPTEFAQEAKESSPNSPIAEAKPAEAPKPESFAKEAVEVQPSQQAEDPITVERDFRKQQYELFEPSTTTVPKFLEQTISQDEASAALFNSVAKAAQSGELEQYTRGRVNQQSEVEAGRSMDFSQEDLARLSEQFKGNQQQIAAAEAYMRKVQQDAMAKAKRAAESGLEEDALAWRASEALSDFVTNTFFGLRAEASRGLSVFRQFTYGIDPKRKVEYVNSARDLLTRKLQTDQLESKTLAPKVDESPADFTKQQEHIAQLEAKIADLESKQAMKNLQRKASRTKRSSTKEALSKEWGDLTEEFNQWARKSLSGTRSTFDAEGAKIVTKLAVNAIKRGINTLEGVVSEVYNRVKDYAEGVTESDIRRALSGYGIETTQGKPNEIQAQLAELKKQAALIEKIADAEQGIEPSKKAITKKPDSTEVADLKAKLKAEMEAQGFGQLSEAEQLAKFKETTKKSIANLEEQLRTGQFNEKAKLSLDPEAEALKKQLAKLRGDVNKAKQTKAFTDTENKIFTRDDTLAILDRVKGRDVADPKNELFSAHDLLTIGGYYYEGGIDTKSNWKKQMKHSIPSISEQQLNEIWKGLAPEINRRVAAADSRESLIKSTNKLLGKDRAKAFFEAIADIDPNDPQATLKYNIAFKEHYPYSWMDKWAARQKRNALSAISGAILDGVSTQAWQAIRIPMNAIEATLQNAIERSQGSTTLSRKPVKEALATAYGFNKEIGTAFKTFFNSFWHGMNPEVANRFDYNIHHDLGGVKNPLNWLSRMRQALNDAQNSAAESQSRWAEAARQGKTWAETKQLAENPALLSDASQAKILEQEKFLTFTDDADKLLNAAYGIRSLSPNKAGLQWGKVGEVRPLEFLKPFMRTRYNLMKRGLEMSPFGYLQLLSPEVRKSPELRAAAISRATASLPVIAGLTYYALQGNITGAAPDYETQRDEWQRWREKKIKPYSINIDGYWFPYKDIPGTSTMFAIAAGIADMKRLSGSYPTDEVITKAAIRFGNQATDGLPLRELVGLGSERGYLANMEFQLANAASSTIIPMSASMREWANFSDEWDRQTEGVYQQMLEGIPVLRQKMLKKNKNNKNPKSGVKALIPFAPQQGARVTFPDNNP